jgi:GH25 family lysozyme M1 (1,4-beta-N-acetylmuramidase)
MIWIADISNHQSGISIEKIVSEGYSAVICKASEGTSFRDGLFDGFVQRIKAVGAIPGAYHFLRAGDGAAQARILHGRVAAHGGPGGFLCALDNEADASWATTADFARAWREISGGHPLIMYTGGWWWRPRGWNGASLTPHLWHSHYVTGSGPGSELYGQVTDGHWNPGYGGWSSATILQFSSHGRVAGREIDVNAFRGSLGELRALTGTASEGDDEMNDDERAWLARCVEILATLETGDPLMWTKKRVKAQDQLNAMAEQMGQLAARPAALPAQITEDRLTEIIKAAAEAAVRKVLGEVDGK